MWCWCRGVVGCGPGGRAGLTLRRCFHFAVTHRTYRPKGRRRACRCVEADGHVDADAVMPRRSELGSGDALEAELDGEIVDGAEELLPLDDGVLGDELV